MREQHSRLNTAAIEVGSGAFGAGLGVHIANTHFPAHVELIPGTVEADVSFNLHDSGVSASYGPTVDAPEVPVEGPFIGEFGVNADITTLNVATDNEDSIAGLTALFADPQNNIADPVMGAIIERSIQGGAVGAVASAYLGYQGLKAYRHLRHGQMAWLKDKISRPVRKRLAIACGFVALAGCGSVAAEQVQENQIAANPAAPQALNTEITEAVPLLRNATVQGAGSEFPNKLARLVVEYQKSVDKSLGLSADNFEREFAAFSQNSKLLNQEGLKVAGHFSDAHCNYANYEFIMPPVLRAFRPDLILNNGDIYTNSNTTVFEDSCMNGYRNAIKEAGRDTGEYPTTYIVKGNHDPALMDVSAAPSVVTLNTRRPSAETEIGRVVGAEDPSVTKWSTTPEEGSAELYEALAAKGKEVVDDACAIEEEHGERPIVMVHRAQMGYRAELSGCARLVLDGHTHVESGLSNHLSWGDRLVRHHTAGTTSGTHNTLPFYETPKMPANYTFMYFDGDNILKGTVSVSFYADESVKIEEKMADFTQSADAQYQRDKRLDYLRQYDPSYRDNKRP